MKLDYERVTNTILEALDKGLCPWRKPWKSKAAHGIGGKPYSGINWLLMNWQPYAHTTYITFRKCKELGGNVRKGEHGHLVVFQNHIPQEKDENGEVIKWRHFGGCQIVFNVEQCEGLPAKLYEDGCNFQHEDNIDGEQIIAAYCERANFSKVTHGGSGAFYTPSEDSVNVPPKSAFPKVEEYYSTMFHELAHSTGSQDRLNRKKGGHFGDEKYAFEELVAELTAAMLCDYIGITCTVENSAAYCKHWAKSLREMPKTAIVRAAGLAKKAAEYILGKPIDGATADSNGDPKGEDGEAASMAA